MNGPNSSLHPTQPILVILVWRGGARFRRALDSIRSSEKYFKRIILSITSTQDSEDMKLASNYRDECANLGFSSKAEIICTGRATHDATSGILDQLPPRDWCP